MRRWLKKSGKQGLTLIEVLMALAIMGIGIVGLVSSASRCLAVVRKSKNYENARRLLGDVEMKFQEHLLELEEGDELSEDSESWSFESPYADYSGFWSLSEVGEGEEESEGLFEVLLRITWSDKGRDTHEEVVTYIYSPTEASGGSVESKP